MPNNLSGQSVDEITQVMIDKGDGFDLGSAIPYYYQLRKFIKRKIKAGEWKSGQKLPSEQALCAHFGVSRTVVRQALGDLTSDNFIETHKGKGSFVAAPKHAWQLMQSLTGFYQDAEVSGQKISTQVLDLKVIPAANEVTEFLNLAEGDPVIMMKRLRFINDEPVVLVVNYIPEKLCPSLVNEDADGRWCFSQRVGGAVHRPGDAGAGYNGRGAPVVARILR